ncbi:ubiquinone biosynthesis hydroxylase [Aureimonas fodinaquatilis]|uniref:Ubiquinone biosynthesis hydroxylase n=1 Tax=Aureimonas fodinaquatilis TaxID=2565783 RepID=A0A5B0DUP6_9HYPH|nr:ubiquinone biosynthesis hydroxylase [Aureimonas fodinaquatilis]KAA0969665.1 ubiquinone biosynthesis hydroxylase [Aureimonas fodinaquatilis]
MDAPVNFDIVIAGGNYVGLSTAVAIRQFAPGLSILLVDMAPEAAWTKDNRASAVAAAASRMLEQLGVWQEVLPSAQPINEMIVTDSRLADPVRPVFLTFDGEVRPGEPFAHMVPNIAMTAPLREKARALGVDVRFGVAVSSLQEEPAAMRVRLSSGEEVRARLVVAADGVNSKLRDMIGIKTVYSDYGQSGIVVTVAHERPHEGRAEEHFLPAGPFAILPLQNNRSSLVWTESTREAERLVAADAMVFELELERRFGFKLGALTVEGKPRAFPLGLRLARDFVRPRFALVGDSAHGMHPIAGQGLNYGFKDVAALAQTIVEAARIGRDIGAIDVLESYQQWRRFDTVKMGATTDILNRLFSNDNAVLRRLRDFGLSLVDRTPLAKSYFIGAAAGLSETSGPRLLRGEAL